MEIEQDQVVAVLPVKLADHARVHRGRDRGMAGAAQYALQKKDIGLLIVNDQDFSVKDVG